MQPPDGAREHERGVLLAITVLVVTTAIAVVIAMLLLVGCAAEGVTTGTDGSAVPGRPLPDRVVVHLGTNGYTDAAEIDALLGRLAAVPLHPSQAGALVDAGVIAAQL